MQTKISMRPSACLAGSRLVFPFPVLLLTCTASIIFKLILVLRFSRKPETWSREISCSSGRILRHGESWDCAQIFLSLVLPLHMVKKKDNGGWRPCGDFRRLNSVTIPDRYPLPNIADFTAHIAGSTVFSRLDFQKGYYQILMASKDIPKTAIITPFGKF